MPRKRKNIYQRKTGAGKEGTSREGRRPEKLYMDMSTLLPMRKQRKRETKQQMEWIRKS